MLDDLKYIHQRDGSDALGIAEHGLDEHTRDVVSLALEDAPQDVEVVVRSRNDG